MTSDFDTKKIIIESVLSYLKQKTDSVSFPLVVELANHYFSGCYLKDLECIEVEELGGRLLSLFEFINQRPKGQANVRAYNPELKRDYWDTRHSVIEVVAKDMSCIVSSLNMCLQRNEVGIFSCMHPVLPVQRDAGGVIISIGHDLDNKEIVSEAIVRIEIEHQDEESLQALIEDVKSTLHNVKSMSKNDNVLIHRFQSVVERTSDYVNKFNSNSVVSKEVVSFLNWLSQDRFRLIAFREYEYTEAVSQNCMRLVKSKCLGIYKDLKENLTARKVAALTEGSYSDLLIVSKSESWSPVHRSSHMDFICIAKFNESGVCTGEYRFYGLFNSVIYTARAQEIPWLRGKLNELEKVISPMSGSHNERVLKQLLDTFPRDDLLQADVEELEPMVRRILESGERRQLRLFLRRDRLGQFMNALVYLPKERLSTDSRVNIESLLLKRFGGNSSEFSIQHLEGVHARIRFMISLDETDSSNDEYAGLEGELSEMLCTWDERLVQQIYLKYYGGDGYRLASFYEGAFPISYRERFDPENALDDILQLELLGENNAISTTLYKRNDDEYDLKVFGNGDFQYLSYLLPILENLGINVETAQSYNIDTVGKSYWLIHFKIRFRVKLSVGGLNYISLQELFVKVFCGDVENDVFNSLSSAFSLGWREVQLLRCVGRYLHQIQFPFSMSIIVESLLQNSKVSNDVLRLFHAKFDPYKIDRDDAVAKLRTRISDDLDNVKSIEHDRILRAYYYVIESILRTNYYQFSANGNVKSTLSLKLDPQRIPGVPAPCPHFEVFVYSAKVEGVHLRGGKVSRGGIRWSDRRDDYRTEVLGLVKAQMVKNAVIVPSGAKGGFICKQLSSDRHSHTGEAIECYKDFIQSLLDITDNLIGERTVIPENTICYDDPDPYLVVAADKGTATFSDTANKIAIDNGFWLGDAFASGGSNGYDHKKMGITARGAWESVKRAFIELGKDIYSDTFSVAGIGDMSGDVFGNGMLLSENIHLVAAFNHQHIFIDPTPDAQRSYVERQRLFSRPKSGWNDYDNKLISAGGGVFDRSAKWIDVTEPMRIVLGLEQNIQRMEPDNLIKAILKAPIELLWNGGIGTYVKAADESPQQANDRTNDTVRVDGRELRAAIVGEGGNLGLTQKGRIEYARCDGRIATDAIDNSAGVDCSDHEVNIKILLNPLVDAEELTEVQRNQLLATMENDVSRLVLNHNYLQGRILSLESEQSVHNLNAHHQLMQLLEKEVRLDRQLEGLPDDESISDLVSMQQGLTKPELSVLLAYTKTWLYEQLLGSEVISDTECITELLDYFPAPLRADYTAQIVQHPLSKEIIATHLTNQIVNRVGILFCFRLQSQCQASVDQILKAYIVARRLLSAVKVWQDLERLDCSQNRDQIYSLLQIVNKQIEAVTVWLIANADLGWSISELCDFYTGGVTQTIQIMEVKPAGKDPVLDRAAINLLKDMPLSEPVQKLMQVMSAVCPALDIINIADEIDQPIEAVAELHYKLEAELKLSWLNESLSGHSVVDDWQQKARTSLLSDLKRSQHNRLKLLLDAQSNSQQLYSNWLTKHTTGIRQLNDTVQSIKASDVADLAMYTVAVHQVAMLD